MDVSLRETLRVRFEGGCKQGGNPLFNWWAEQDSNLQPDRYERPALTIELSARRRGGRGVGERVIEQNRAAWEARLPTHPGAAANPAEPGAACRRRPPRRM